MGGMLGSVQEMKSFVAIPLRMPGEKERKGSILPAMWRFIDRLCRQDDNLDCDSAWIVLLYDALPSRRQEREFVRVGEGAMVSWTK